ncbi:hypothetical protein B0H13DRAFT_1548053, partial [Mycena leptocephala]
MDTLPDEILLHISNLVCTELRRTARILSTVSKRFHAISCEFLYRVIDIAGHNDIHQLASNLERTSARCRQIQHLYACDTSNLGRPGHPIDVPGTEDVDTDSIIRILEFTAPTVESLAICLSPTNTSAHILSRLFLLPFPQLQELSILGPYPLPSSTGNFPRLRYLHLSGNMGKINRPNVTDLFSSGSLASSFPCLTHLYMSSL